MITNKDAFKVEFIATVTTVLRITNSDVVVNDVICGSVDVIFTVKNARSINITGVLWMIIKNESFVIYYRGLTFTARHVEGVVEKPFISTTSAPLTSPTKDHFSTSSDWEKKKIRFIIFALVGAVFIALFIFSLVIFSSRFCACCRKSKTFSLQRKRLSPFELELKRFTARRDVFLRANFYGEASGAEKEDAESLAEDSCDHEEGEGARDERGTVTTVLLGHRKHTNTNNRTAQKFVFDDDDSCSSVLFY